MLLPLLATLIFASDELPSADDFAHHALRLPHGERVEWHLDRHAASARGLLVVFLTGSGSAPMFQSYEDGAVGFSAPGPLFDLMDRAHLLIVDKPGVPFAAATEWDEDKGRPLFEPGPAFAAMTRQQLVARNAAAARAALRELGDAASGVVLVGYSEGGQYVFDLAAELHEATHAVAIGGNALPQWYDFVLDARQAADRGEITRQEAEARIEALYETMRDVEARPESGTVWNGHDYRRWATFGPYAPVGDMLALDIPLLLIQGGNDANAPILNTDYAMIAFIGAGKNNLDYWVYPDLDHFLTEADPTDPDLRVDRTGEVFERLWRWIEAVPEEPQP